MERFNFALKPVNTLLIFILVISISLLPASPVMADTHTLTLTGIQPDRAANDVDTPVEITGSGFSSAEKAPQVFLGSVPLTQVTWIDENKLTAQVNWGMDPGTYDLKVVNSDGSEETLASAFEVTRGIGQWNSNAIDGGPVRTVLPIPATAGLIYAHSTVTSGVFRSTDYGAHWSTVGHASGEFFKNDAFDADVLYLNSLKSTNGGVTWQDMLSGAVWPGTEKSPRMYTQVFVNPEVNGTLFLATADIPEGSGAPSGLLRSTDSGGTWTSAETGLLAGDTGVTAMEFSGEKIYLGTRNGNLYQSGNGGTSWERIGSSAVLASIGVIKVNPANTSELWVTTHYAASAPAKVATVSLSSTPASVTELNAWPGDNYPRSLEFLDGNTAFMATNWDHGWITTDSGAHWKTFEPSTGKPGYSLALDPWDLSKNSFYIADEQFGVQKTTNRGNTWSITNLGLHAMSPNFIDADPANPSRVYAKIVENGWPGIFISDNGGQNWNFSSLESDSGYRPTVSMLAVNAGRVFVGAHGGGDPTKCGPQLYYSDHQGSSWSLLSLAPVPDYSESFHMPWSLQADPQQPQTLLMNVIIGNHQALTTDKYVSEIYRSTDNGLTWQRVDLAGQVGRQINNLSQLAFDPLEPGVVYASADREILKSTDHGLTWSVIRTEQDTWLGAIAIEPVSPHRIYVGSLVSLDGGETWNPANLPISVNQMTFVPNSDTLYLAGDGLKVSYNGGTTWQTPSGALASLQINAIKAILSDQRTILYIGTPGGETPDLNPTALRSARAGSSLLEAGVYRMTEIHYPVYLPLLRK